jgi:hypothetical protein
VVLLAEALLPLGDGHERLRWRNFFASAHFLAFTAVRYFCTSSFAAFASGVSLSSAAAAAGAAAGPSVPWANANDDDMAAQRIRRRSMGTPG